MVAKAIEFEVQQGDVTTFDADVIALKFAQGLFGADQAVAGALGCSGDYLRGELSDPGAYRIWRTDGKIKAKLVLFVGTPPLYAFDYGEIRKFAARVLKVLKNVAHTTEHLAMTIHGVGYGLDESEAFRSQLAGCLDAFDSRNFPQSLKRITIVEREPGRAKRLRIVLKESIPGGAVTPYPEPETQNAQGSIERSPLVSAVGRESADKPHIFVAMPFAEKLDDVYHYGIQSPVNAAGYLCERIDATAFTGDILERIKLRIETASLVIADLTTTNPNVFLEVGYAWGKGRPTILLVQDVKELPFDVRGQRCLVYGKIQDLEKALAKEIQALKENLN